jgi:hypothetical protein
MILNRRDSHLVRVTANYPGSRNICDGRLTSRTEGESSYHPRDDPQFYAIQHIVHKITAKNDESRLTHRLMNTAWGGYGDR